MANFLYILCKILRLDHSPNKIDSKVIIGFNMNDERDVTLLLHSRLKKRKNIFSSEPYFCFSPSLNAAAF